MDSGFGEGRHYYNENDPKTAHWLKCLVAAQLIPAGHIDSRSIAEVTPADLKGFRQCHFFAGIAGWAYALALAGWDRDREIWTGSCPCQPFSCAGKGLGEKDERHLWPVFRELIRQCRPPTIFGEQVASAAGRLWYAGVRADLETMGYRVGAADLCAASPGEEGEGRIVRGDSETWEQLLVGAPHIRQRLYWVADHKGQRRPGMVAEHEEGERQRPRARSSSAALRLEQSDSKGWLAGQPGTEAARHGNSTNTNGGISWMGEPIQQGLERHAGNGNDRNEPGRIEAQKDGPTAPASPWSDFRIIQCGDNKARRIESRTQPLVDGPTGRVGLLRGYGNAIIPQVAAEFIKAYLETL